MKNKLTYYSLIILMISLLIIPYEFNNIFNIIPIRLLICCIFIAIYFVERLFLKANYKKVPKPPIILFLIFISIATITLFCTTSILTTLYTLLKFISIGFIAYAIYSCNFSKEQYKNIVKIFLIISTIILVYGIITYIFNFNLNYNGIYKYGEAKGRVHVTFINPIYYGMFLSILLILILYILFEKKDLNIYHKIYMFILMILIATNVYLTYTRSTYCIVALCIGFTFLIYLKEIKKIYKKYLMVILAFLLPMLYINEVFAVVSSTINELFFQSEKQIIDSNVILDKNNDYKYIDSSNKVDGSNTDGNEELITEESDNHNNNSSNNIDGSMLTRYEFKKLAKRVIKDNIYLGVGFGNYENYLSIDNNKTKYITGKFGYPHDNYLHIFAETGIVGLVSFVSLLGYSIIKSILMFIKTKNKGYLFIFITFVYISLLCFYESFFYNSQTMPLYTVLLLLLINYIKCHEGSEYNFIAGKKI